MISSRGVANTFLLLDQRYRQDMTAWSFGKLGALREASMAIEGDYRYYYMGMIHRSSSSSIIVRRRHPLVERPLTERGQKGFYIHSCAKMRYKRDYKTQEVLGTARSYICSVGTFLAFSADDPLPLDPESYGWDPLNDDFLGRLGDRKYVCLSRERRFEGDDDDPATTTTTSSSPPPANDHHPAKSETHRNDDDDDDDDDDDISDDDGPWPTIFSSGMQGLMTIDEVINAIDLDRVLVRVHGETFEARVNHHSINLSISCKADTGNFFSGGFPPPLLIILAIF